MQIEKELGSHLEDHPIYDPQELTGKVLTNLCDFIIPMYIMKTFEILLYIYIDID
jgi:hypothetical protein